MSHLQRRLLEEQIDQKTVVFTNYLNTKHGEEKMVAEVKHRRDRLTKAEKSNIRDLHSQGYTYEQISELTGRSQGSIVRTMKKKRYYIPKSEQKIVEKTVDWKAKYLKAVALLIENDLIEVDF